MDVTLVFADDGSVKAAVVKGATYEEAAAKLKQLAKAIGQNGIAFRLDGEPEKHTHGPEGQHVLRSSQIKA